MSTRCIWQGDLLVIFGDNTGNSDIIFVITRADNMEYSIFLCRDVNISGSDRRIESNESTEII